MSMSLKNPETGNLLPQSLILLKTHSRIQRTKILQALRRSRLKTIIIVSFLGIYMGRRLSSAQSGIFLCRKTSGGGHADRGSPYPRGVFLFHDHADFFLGSHGVHFNLPGKRHALVAFASGESSSHFSLEVF